jgi:uncharacterized protein YdiU (UPF0061 family)
MKEQTPTDSTFSYRPAPVMTELGEGFYDAVAAAVFPQTTLRYRNQRWAERVGLSDLSDAQWSDHFGRFEALPGNLREPLALRYHGHQFHSYNPDIGDGRGFLFAQLLDGHDERLLDLATKGSGRTPWSRSGDGRLTLKGGVREILATEMLEALGVYTSKTFSLIETGEELERGDEPSPTRSAVLVRLGHSHIRFGSFQRHAYAKDTARIRALVDYSVAHYMPDLAVFEGEERVAAFLARTAERTAELAASWQLAGFVHGVLNTDNMNITGESFDYGPFRFLPTFDPNFTAAYFDHSGLYAYGRQPTAAVWNLTRLAETLLPICPENLLVDALGCFQRDFPIELERRLLNRLNLRAQQGRPTAPLAEVVFGFLTENAGESVKTTADIEAGKGLVIGFERFFFDWFGGTASPRLGTSLCSDLYSGERARGLRQALEGFEEADPTRGKHSYFAGQGPCTMLVDEVEKIWDAIADSDDWSLLDAKLSAVGQMREALGLGENGACGFGAGSASFFKTAG